MGLEQILVGLGPAEDVVIELIEIADVDGPPLAVNA